MKQADETSTGYAIRYAIRLIREDAAREAEKATLNRVTSILSAAWDAADFTHDFAVADGLRRAITLVEEMK